MATISTTSIEALERYHVANKERWNLFCSTAEYVLEYELRKHSIYAEVSSRVKTLDSCTSNVEKYGFVNPVSEINDFCGIRIVCVFTRQLDQIEDIIQRIFLVSEKTDKKLDLSMEKMGYQSRHFNATLSDKLSGPHYDDLRSIPCEIQLRTVMQHAWAIASHLLSYKGKLNAPAGIEREINNTSAALDVLQTHIDNIDASMRQEAPQGTIRELLKKPIDKNNLVEYCSYRFGHIGISDLWLDRIINDLGVLGYRSIDEIDSIVSSTLQPVMRYAGEYPEMFGYSSDYLSKCLSFGDSRFLRQHPVSDLTRAKVREYHMQLATMKQRSTKASKSRSLEPHKTRRRNRGGSAKN